ncbi:MAG: phosphatase PAP2 family protein [Coprococcus sp.]|nr:phosphatase PAP2 family protein [Coprococcus sp.]
MLWQKFKELFYKYHHIWVFLYGFIYMGWFTYLERTVTDHYFVIHSVFDNYIPFLEVFIIPYFLWFFYIGVTLFYFFFRDKQGFYKVTALLAIGMTTFLVICTVFPNGLNLRPTVFERDNIFIDMVKMLYRTDTPTNVLPSLHVYNSIGCHIAICHSDELLKYKWVQRGSLLLTVLIVLSTMFLKQHSVVDVMAACVMAYFIYQFVYAGERLRIPKLARQTI